MERLKNLIDRSVTLWVRFPLQSIRIFNLSMSVCDEQFVVRIYIYHSDDVILQLIESLLSEAS